MKFDLGGTLSCHFSFWIFAVEAIAADFASFKTGQQGAIDSIQKP